MTKTQLLFAAVGRQTVTAVRYRAAAALAHSASNYYVVTVYRRKPASGAQSADKHGEVVGSFTTRTHDLPAGTPVTLYPAVSGSVLSMKDGEELWGVRVSTGSPALLDGPAYSVEVQPDV